MKLKTRIVIFQVNNEKCITEYLKSLKSLCSLSLNQYKKIKAVGSRTGILYGQCKDHKRNADAHSPSTAILSTIGACVHL